MVNFPQYKGFYGISVSDLEGTKVFYLVPEKGAIRVFEDDGKTLNEVGYDECNPRLNNSETNFFLPEIKGLSEGAKERMEKSGLMKIIQDLNNSDS